MEIKTHGIVLHALKYSESATIITVYTLQFGRATYMVYGVNKKKAACRAAFIQPLSIVEMDVLHTPTKEIHRIKDIRIAYPYSGIPFNPVKNAVGLFIAEILYRTLKQAEPDEQLYAFLDNSLQYLDCCEEGIANFHLVFLSKLTRHLGFSPSQEEFSNMYFDLQNGIFQQQRPLHKHFLLPEVAQDFAGLLKADYSSMQHPAYSRQRRIELLEALMEYYRLHVVDFNGVHSLAVLHSLFD